MIVITAGKEHGKNSSFSARFDFKAEALANNILKRLQLLGLDAKFLVGQSYNGVSCMSSS